jgi:2-hydroxy-3-keto-5-methylthiopentenyl-1-phosphate phosphatase
MITADIAIEAFLLVTGKRIRSKSLHMVVISATNITLLVAELFEQIQGSNNNIPATLVAR